MEILDLDTLGEDQFVDSAYILRDSLPQGWPEISSAMEEIGRLLAQGNVLLAAVRRGSVIGWGGIMPHYDGRVYEIHPLVVREDQRGRGIGRRIITALENRARALGGLMIHAGCDDMEAGQTSLANVDLFDDLPGRIRAFSPGAHASGFYLRVGYQIIGVMPDANGIGKPDIIMGKRL